MKQYALKLDNYGISVHRYRELLHMCRQYDEMRRKLDRIRQGVDEPTPSASGPASLVKDPTGSRAARAADSWCSARIAAIEQAAIAADPAVAPYIIRNATHGTSYDAMRARDEHLPCGREMFYELRRKFFWLLDSMV